MLQLCDIYCMYDVSAILAPLRVHVVGHHSCALIPSNRTTRHFLTLMDRYNRARGTELLSPDDLLCACEHLTELDVGMQLKRFESGVLVIQDKAQSDEAIVARVLAAAKEGRVIAVCIHINQFAQHVYTN